MQTHHSAPDSSVAGTHPASAFTEKKFVDPNLVLYFLILSTDFGNKTLNVACAPNSKENVFVSKSGQIFPDSYNPPGSERKKFLK